MVALWLHFHPGYHGSHGSHGFYGLMIIVAIMVIYGNYGLYPQCTNPDHVGIPNTTIPTIPSVRAPGYTLRELEFRLLKAIRQLTIRETDVRDYDMVGISVFRKHAFEIKM